VYTGTWIILSNCVSYRRNLRQFSQ